MAVGTALMVASAAAGVYSAVQQNKAGNAQAANYSYQGQYNAQVYDQQAQMIQEQKKLSDYQYSRQAGHARGTLVSKIAGSGINLSGSPLAVLIDNESQMMLDKATNDYNLDVQKNYAQSGANYYRYQGQQQAALARSTGKTNAFSTVLNTAAQLAPFFAGKL